LDAKTLNNAIPQRKHAKNNPLSKKRPGPSPKAPRQKRLKSTTQEPNPDLTLCYEPYPTGKPDQRSRPRNQLSIPNHNKHACATTTSLCTGAGAGAAAQKPLTRRRAKSTEVSRGLSGRPNAPILLPAPCAHQTGAHAPKMPRGLLVLLLGGLLGAVAFAGCSFARSSLVGVLVAADCECSVELLLLGERLGAASDADRGVLFDFQAV
jgi:hypothetical protein